MDGAEANHLTNVGEFITCTYEIGNSGTQTLGNFCLTDDNVGNGNGCIECGAADVSPGGGFPCSTTYEVECITYGALEGWAARVMAGLFPYRAPFPQRREGREGHTVFVACFLVNRALRRAST